MSQVHFSFVDYFLFAIVILVSLVIGLYYGFRSKKHLSVEEYLLGGRNVHIFPVIFSLAATMITGSATVGQSMEVYSYGLQNVMLNVVCALFAIIMHFVFLPVFYELQLMSSFSYLEMRFDGSVKYLASALFVISGLLLLPLTIYVPALEFQQVSGINLYVIAVVLMLLCIWYTAIGGIKAVVWTDVFQYVLILGSGIVILFVGLTSVGGIDNVWNALKRGGRSSFIKTSFDPEERGTIWAYFLSVIFLFIYQFGINQSMIQRYISLSSIKKAKIALWGQCILYQLILLMFITIGGIIYTTYETCDPLTMGVVQKIDQVFPHYVQEKASLFVGFNGMFIAGVFAAGLSTTSTLLNTLSGTIYNDFLGKRLKDPQRLGKIMNIIVTLVGLSGILVMLLIEKMGTIVTIAIQCFSLSTVGVFGLFANGMIFPKINSKGTKYGVVISMLAVGILIIGGLSKKPEPPLPLRVDGCSNTTIGTLENISSVNSSDSNLNILNEGISWIFRVNYQYYCLIGLFINIVIASIVSVLTGGNTVSDQRLLVPFLRRKTHQEPLMNNDNNS